MNCELSAPTLEWIVQHDKSDMTHWPSDPFPAPVLPLFSEGDYPDKHILELSLSTLQLWLRLTTVLIIYFSILSNFPLLVSNHQRLVSNQIVSISASFLVSIVSMTDSWQVHRNGLLSFPAVYIHRMYILTVGPLSHLRVWAIGLLSWSDAFSFRQCAIDGLSCVWCEIAESISELKFVEIPPIFV
jgi:hypothetical protein